MVTGALRLDGAVSIIGLARAGSITWDGGASPLGPAAVVPTPAADPRPELRGALLSAGDYRGDAAPAISHDADVLKRLGRQAGTFARVAGSWKDFR